MICLDTHVVIWGIKGEASPGQESMVQKTKQYINHQVEAGTEFMIPAPVVSETLIRGTTSQLQTVRTLMEKWFLLQNSYWRLIHDD